MKKIIVLVLLGIIILSCAGKDNKTTNGKSASVEPKAIDGKKIFKQNCVICHGMDGKLGINNSKDLTLTTMDLEERIAIITNGKGTMTAFNSLLSEQKIKAVAEYSMTLK